MQAALLTQLPPQQLLRQQTATATEAAAETTTAESADAADTALADGSYTIGINQFAVHGSLDNCREGFLQGLAENGIVEGKNLTVLEENAQADPGLAAQISTNFAGQKVDLDLRDRNTERPERIRRRQKERHPGHLYSRYGSGRS